MASQKKKKKNRTKNINIDRVLSPDLDQNLENTPKNIKRPAISPAKRTQGQGPS